MLQPRFNTSQQMIPKKLDEIDDACLDALISGGVKESRTIEFKSALQIGKDEEKKEFLADVSSLANAGGGDLIFGIEESDGVATAICGIESFSADSGTLRVEEIVRNGLEPRIIGLQIRLVSYGDDTKMVLIIRVPNSFQKPHMVVFKGGQRFYSRNSSGKYPLDVQELRSAFLSTESQAERIRRFRIERINLILSDDRPFQMEGESFLCLHLMPLISLDPSFTIDLLSCEGKKDDLRPPFATGYNSQFNFDGLSVFCRGIAGTVSSCVQLFRNGTIEALTTEHLGYKKEPEFHGKSLEKGIFESVERFIAFFRSIGIQPPIVVGLSMLGTKGFSMIYPIGMSYYSERNSIDRDHLILQELIVEDFEIPASLFLKPAFDQIWNSCGLRKSENYDDQGNWVDRKYPS
ncbi:MAG: ATP-binding protein [Planctomycetaceae bacterium]|nr:ATP-binding protein [Planctomycetaceae bacterium]